jgi:xylan 1,4-beta-xylosidase
VQIHHSTDLVNWRLVSRPLTRASQLDMRGNPDSCGIWAPCLSWADGLFWLVYTDVKRLDGNFKDAHNYIVTAADDHRPLVRSGLCQFVRFRSVAVSRR